MHEFRSLFLALAVLSSSMLSLSLRLGGTGVLLLQRPSRFLAHTVSSHCPIARSAYSRQCGRSFASMDGETSPSDTITLQPHEKVLFDSLLQMVKACKLRTTIRVAGGWVRDRLLKGVVKNDIDIALEGMTGVEFARKWENWRNSSQAITVGGGEDEQFKRYTVRMNPARSKHLETASVRFGDLDLDFVNLRSETYTAESRFPKMQFGTPYEDAMRRDLTINALFYNLHTGKVEDLTGKGLADLKAGIVRTPLPPLVTLMDDPLRALRIVRFACRFGFRVDSETAQACCDPQVHANLLHKVSGERVQIELSQMLAHPTALRAVHLLWSYGLLTCLLQVPSELFQRKLPTAAAGPGTLGPALKMADVVPYQGEVVQVVPSGVTTILAAHYLRGLLERTGVNLDGENATKSDFAAAQRWVQALTRDGVDYARLFIVPALLTGSRELYVSESAVSGKKNQKNVRPLSEYLMRQLKLPNKDAMDMLHVHNVLPAVVTLLETCVATASSTPSSSGTITTAPATDRKGSSVAAAFVSESIPLTYCGVERLQLGTLLRRAGEHYPLVVLLAAAHILQCRLAQRICVGSGQGGRNALSAAKWTGLCSQLAQLNAIQHSDGATPSPDAAVEAVYRQEARTVLAGLEVLVQAMEAMQLKTVWAEQPPFSGTDLQREFPELPKTGPIFGELRSAQLDWMLLNPQGSKDQLLVYLKHKFCLQ